MPSFLFVSADVGDKGDGEGVTESLPDLRKLTFDSNLRSTLSFSLGISSLTAVAFPLFCLTVRLSKSAGGGAGDFLERVTERILCKIVGREDDWFIGLIVGGSGATEE